MTRSQTAVWTSSFAIMSSTLDRGRYHPSDFDPYPSSRPITRAV